MKYLQTYEARAVEFTKVQPSQDHYDMEIPRPRLSKFVEYDFSVDDIDYRVHFFIIDRTATLSFSVLNDEGDWDMRNLDKSNPFTTMNTITQIVKSFVEEYPNINKIEFFGKQDMDMNIPDWLVDLVSSNKFLTQLAVFLDTMLTPPQWLSKPSRRTKMFTRWIDKEVKSINWSVRRQGNKIQLVKNKSIKEGILNKELIDNVTKDIFADILENQNEIIISSYRYNVVGSNPGYTICIDWDKRHGFEDDEYGFYLTKEMVDCIKFCMNYLSDEYEMDFRSILIEDSSDTNEFNKDMIDEEFWITIVDTSVSLIELNFTGR